MKLRAYQIARIKRQLNTGKTKEVVQSIKAFENVDLAGLLTSLDKHQAFVFFDGLLSLGRASAVLS